MPTWVTHLSPFHRNAAAALDLPALAARHHWPDEYVQLLAFMDGGEGFVGTNYVRIFSHGDALWLNLDTPLRDLPDDLFVFGSTGGGDAFAFDPRSGGAVTQVPFIPLTRRHATRVAHDLRTWLTSAPATPPRNPDLIGKEIHEITPIVFGGDPVDPKNKALLDLRTYAEAAAWWNRLYLQMQPADAGR